MRPDDAPHTEPKDVHHTRVKPRAEDAERSLRQRMGIDGDAREEERQAAERGDEKNLDLR